jgi:hypothetical protein
MLMNSPCADIRDWWCALAVRRMRAAGASSGQHRSKLRLELEQVTIETARGPVNFTVEIADDEAERNRGLMFRQSLPRDRGMLFHFQEPEMASFWMRNTPSRSTSSSSPRTGAS